jgi:hypothetical protein
VDPRQDPETLELFKADLARRFFDGSTSEPGAQARSQTGRGQACGRECAGPAPVFLS